MFSSPRPVSPLFFNHTPPRRATPWVWGAPSTTNRTLHMSRTSNPLSIITWPFATQSNTTRLHNCYRLGDAMVHPICSTIVLLYPLPRKACQPPPSLVGDVFCRHFLGAADSNRKIVTGTLEPVQECPTAESLLPGTTGACRTCRVSPQDTGRFKRGYELT